MTALPLGYLPDFHAGSDPDRLAIRCGTDSLTRAEFASAVSRGAVNLLAAGASAGSTVAIALPNGVDFLVAAFAAWRVDATPLPLSAALPAAEREALLDLASPAVVISTGSTAWTDLSPEGLLADTGDAPELPMPSGDRPWKLIGSGGSTGRPKLILSNSPASADPLAERYTIRGEDVVLVPGPLYHQGPFIFSTAGLITGAPVILMPRFDAAEALSLIDHNAVTWTFMVPTMTHRIWRLGEVARSCADLSSLRLLFSTGAPWPSWLKANWMDWLGPDRVIEWYGGTEEQGGLRITGQEAADHPGAIGRADDDVRVVTPDGLSVASGEIGELVFRARPAGSHQYIGLDNTDEPWRGYGDLAFIDEQGYVHLVDRRTDLVISGGVNVYPAEVEGALEAHPHVQSAVVIGLPHDDLGQYVHAVVELDALWQDRTPDDDLRAHLRTLISAPKIPRHFEYTNSPLRDDAGKVRRSAVREARLTPMESQR